MSQSIHLISRNVPGYGPSDGQCFPCSGVSGKAVNVSPCSSRGNYKTFSPVKNLSLKCTSRSNSSVGKASSSGHRRNPDFPRQNKHVFLRSRNRQNEERDGYENVEESEVFSSKNGPLLSVSSNPKFQATATPGPREKEILELFRKVQAQLQERAAINEEKMIEDSQGQSKERETVDSLLKLLRKHSVQQGKRSSNSGRDFILDQAERYTPFSEEKSTSIFDINNSTEHDVHHSEGTSLSRPKSAFRRTSRVPQKKFQPIHSHRTNVNSISSTVLSGRREETILKVEPDTEPDPESDPVLIFSDIEAFDEMTENETSDIDEDDNGDDVDAGKMNVIGLSDLSGMKISELRALAKSRGLKGYSKLKKSELVELLTQG